MALIYGLMRSLAVTLFKYAAWQHNRLKRQFEKLDAEFRSLETDCKAEEVRLGRPVEFASQLKLLKQFEKREVARQNWIRASKKMQKRRKLASKVRSFSGRKLPYTFGLIDMALLMRLIEMGYRNGFQWSSITDFVARLI